MNPETIAYVQARCDARRAMDRHQRREANQAIKAASRVFACATQALWPELDAAKAFLDKHRNITDPATFASLFAESQTA